MHTREDRRLLVKAARLYYEQDLTQEEIAERLRLSRQKVQRMLRDARVEGIVRIAITPLMGVSTELERALEQRYGLSEVVIVETTAHQHGPTVARDVGTAAAHYLLRVVRPGDRVVIGWGNSLLGMINALPHNSRLHPANVSIIQGLGGIGDPNNEFHSVQLVRAASRALGAYPVLLPAPGIAGSSAARDAFYADPNVARVLDMACNADLMFTGIGAVDAETIRVPEFWEVMTQATIDDLKRHGAAGSINLRYFDERGRPVSSHLDQCTIGLTLSDLARIRRVVGVAGGAGKVAAIKAALDGGILGVLVTDQVTAEKLLEGAGKASASATS